MMKKLNHLNYMAQDIIIKIPLQMTTMIYDYFHVVTVSLKINVVSTQQCGVPAIIVCYIKSSFAYRPSHSPALWKADLKQD